jgi:hypothetical protein
MHKNRSPIRARRDNSPITIPAVSPPFNPDQLSCSLAGTGILVADGERVAVGKLIVGELFSLAVAAIG